MVITTADEQLCIVAHGLLKDGKWPTRELLLFEFA